MKETAMTSMRLRGGLAGAVMCAVLMAGPAAAASSTEAPTVRSQYVAMPDGTRLAIDVWRSNAPATGRVPTVVQFTRYWRALKATGGHKSQAAKQMVRTLTDAGYAVVIVDVRGTGASFGSRNTEFGPQEVEDYRTIFDWIEAQPWSNGRVATMGGSYLGNTAELSATFNHRALRAVAPQFSDFSEYRHAVRPGGVKNAVIANAWMSHISALDRNDGCAAMALPPEDCERAGFAAGVKPVDEDRDGRLLEAAVAEHARNAKMSESVGRLTFSDDAFGSGHPPPTLETVSPSTLWRRIDASRTPAFHWASWFDGGTADGVLTRYLKYKSPLRVVIGPWTHGAGRNADPYGSHGETAIAEPAPEAQLQQVLAFLDPLMKGDPAAAPPTRRIDYFTLGAGEWRSTTQWPPEGIKPQRYFLQAGGGLAVARPSAAASDRYVVDRAATTGIYNRWHTQLGGPVDYGNRAAQTPRLLTYTTAPLDGPTEVTGSPVVRVSMTTTRSDGALFAYLEDVAPNGKVTYLTEGQLRLTFSGRPPPQAGLAALGPIHSFRRQDARPVQPEKRIELNFAMNPISVVLTAGHRLRVSFAGADADSFEQLPANGDAADYNIFSGGPEGSYVELPMRSRAAP